MLREPVGRSVSHARYARQMGHVSSLDFEELIDEDPGLLSRSRYEEFLVEFSNFFGSQVSVLYFEDLRESPDEFASDLFVACGGLPEFGIEVGHENRSGEARSRLAMQCVRLAVRLADSLGARGLIGRLKNSSLRSLLVRPASQSREDELVISELQERLEGALCESRRESSLILDDMGFPPPVAWSA